MRRRTAVARRASATWRCPETGRDLAHPPRRSAWGALNPPLRDRLPPRDPFPSVWPEPRTAWPRLINGYEKPTSATACDRCMLGDLPRRGDANHHDPTLSSCIRPAVVLWPVRPGARGREL